MTPFEVAYLAAEPFVLPLHRRVRRRLLRMGPFAHTPEILDVGGRKSHYTIGVRSRVTITDLPRESSVQHELHLGITPVIATTTMARRSNVETIRIDDMTRSTLPDAAFDCAVAVEVLEHVDEDARFVTEVHRVLKPGGVFLMTTPNGDAVANTNPDHRRHYTKAQLGQLLASRFERVDIEYAIPNGRFRKWGLRAWSIRRPWHTALGMAGNVVNGWQAGGSRVRDDACGTRHLMAVAWKRC